MPLGTCVPKTVALASGNPAAPSLKQDDCSSADYVCTPTLKAQNVNACFTKCQSGLSAAAYHDGACVPIYVATDVSPGALAFVKQTTCGAGEVCAPCEDSTEPGLAEPRLSVGDRESRDFTARREGKKLRTRGNSKNLPPPSDLPFFLFSPPRP